MKRIFTILVAVLLTATLWAQTPQKMTYQAVVRNASNQLVTNQTVGLQVRILQGSATGTEVYIETQTPTTNANGLLTVEIGGQTGFDTITWANAPYFMETSIDPTGGSTYTITGTSQLLTVPYALHAKTAESISGGINETDPVFTGSQANNITATDITNLSNLSGVNTGDQTISRTGLTVTLTNGGTYQDSINTYTAGTGIDITNNVVSLETKHYVGELYGGGIVFYVYDNGQHGLIASLDDLDGGSGVAWSNIDDVEIGASAKDYYNGIGNTAAIIAQSGHTNSAAKLCADYSNNGFTDWYLPSTLELREMDNSILIINNVLANDGDVTTNSFHLEYTPPTYGRYWSSTETTNNYSWVYDFNSGYCASIFKDHTYRVRAVRAF